MINGSTAFNNAVVAGGYPYIVRISEGGTLINCTISACTFTKGSTGSESFGVGTVFVPYVELEITGLNRALENTDILVELGVQINSNSTEWINLGYFRVSKVQSSVIKTNVTAVGRITAVLGLITPTLPSTVTIPALISTIQSAVRDSGFSTFTISYSGITLSNETITSDLSGNNCRQLLEVLASLIGCYATEDNAGNVVLFKYNTSTTIAYDGSRMITHPVVNDSNFSLSNIKVIKEQEQELEDGTIIPEVSYQYSTQIPVDWIMYNPYMENQSMFNTFCTNCIGLTYRPATIILANGDPRIEAVDVLSVTDIDGSVYTVPGLSVSNVLTGGITTTIIAPGETDTEADTEVKGPISQQIDTLTSAVTGAQISADLARAAANRAVEDAGRAEEAAGRAEEAAGQATTLLGQMQTAAEAAGTTLTGIYHDAEDARLSASNASEYASRALGNLSTVQSVAEALTWITAHGTMTPTSDTTLDPTHVYFVVDAQGDYVVGGTHYSVVTEPDVADISTYYELTINESLNNYVATHLAVDSEGLWIIPDAGGNKVLIATGSGSTYTTAGTYIIGKVNGVDTVFAKFASDGATMQAENGTQIAHLGYGEGNTRSGTASSPYYILGQRRTASEQYDSTKTYSVGAMVIHDNKEYVCKYDIDVPENWNSGNWTLPIGNYSVVEGDGTIASGTCSHAEGYHTTALGPYSHTEGYNAKASGGFSHAEGYATTALYTYGHVEGYNSTAWYIAHAEGEGTTAKGQASHAQNYHTIAASSHQTALGRWNEEDSNGTYAVILGNGAGNSARSNAFVVDWQGNFMGQGMAGVIQMYAGSTAPSGWLFCDGSEQLVDDYPLLASVLGTTYGTPSDSDHFVLPDFRGRVPVGVGNGTATGHTNHILGQKSGEETHTLVENELPKINGTFRIRGYQTSGGVNGSILVSTSGAFTDAAAGSLSVVKSGVTGDGTSKTATLSFGNNGTHNNMMPYLGINYIIATGQTS